MYNYELLDPRPTPSAQAINDGIFAAGPVYGIEVTIPALAARCVSNLDPQHGGETDDEPLAAIELAVHDECPPGGATLATVRADLDAIGAMAVYTMRKETALPWKTLERISAVASADRAARGAWRARPLPTREAPWAEGEGELAAIGSHVADFRLSMADRVAAMIAWLETGAEPAGRRDQVNAERAEMITALESGSIAIEMAAGGRIAVVVSEHRAATMLGYCRAPVVVALNPQFRLMGGEPHRKFTICAYAPEHADIRAATAELAAAELGWGGSAMVGGSRQGVASELEIADVVAVVERWMR